MPLVRHVRCGHSPSYAGQHEIEDGIQREVVKHTEAKRGFVLLSRRWVVERSFVWLPASAA
jgi:hypothetical protein